MSAKKQPRERQRHWLFDVDWPEPPHRLMLVDDVHPAVWILGHRYQEIVGESFHADGLHELTSRLDRDRRVLHRDGDSLAIATGWLFPEATNPHTGRPAVAVFVEQTLAGHLSEEAVLRWYPIVVGLESRYRRRVACSALVVGKLHERFLGVYLMLDTDIRKPRPQ